jgi:hypothetical protein
MIAIAREKLAAQPMPQLSFRGGRRRRASVRARRLRRGAGLQLLHLVSDLDRALALAVQALRPGGLLISKTPCIAEMNPLIPHLALPLMRAIGKAPPVLCFNGDALQSAITRQGMESSNDTAPGARTSGRAARHPGQSGTSGSSSWPASRR